MTLSPNTILQGGKYRIEATLGQGGFGITYLATQVSLGRRVAIKEFFMKDLCNRESDTSHVTIPSIGSHEMVERFRTKFVKEAQTIAQFNNPHIVRIHDIFEENGTAYYVMEYHDRGSLADLVKSRGHLSEAEAVEYVRQIGNALDYLHARQINHLDVKPANVLLNEDGEAVLIDFGLAKHYDSEGNQTSTTPVGISHGYAPMEQYKRGGVGIFSPTTDIYSLGATLYKMLTGVTPPEASDLLNEGLPPMTVAVSPAVRNAVEQAMAPLIKDRPQSIGEFLALLNGEKPVVGVVVDDEKTNVVIEEKTTIEPEVKPESTKTVEDTTVPPTPKPKSAPKPTKVPTAQSTPKPAPKQESAPATKPTPEKPKRRRRVWIWVLICALVVAAAGVYMSNQQKVAEEQRLAEEQRQREEAERLRREQIGKIITINGVKAIVFDVDDTCQHGMAMSLEETECNWDDARDWCFDLGEGWRPPTEAELQEIYRNKEQLNKILSSKRECKQLYDDYWSSEECSSDRARCVNVDNGNTRNSYKDNAYSVRAVSAF